VEPAQAPQIDEPMGGEPQPRTRPGRGRALSPKTLAIRKRDADAVSLKAAGYTLQQIADSLGYASKSHAWESIQRTVDLHEIAAVDDYREVTISRLDALLRNIWPYALGIHASQQPARKPDLAALDRVLAIERERCRILGLYAPEQVDVLAIVRQMADAEGLTPDERKDAVEFVEHHLKELRAV